MFENSILPHLCDKNHTSYILFTESFHVFEYAQNINVYLGDEITILDGSDIRDYFYELIGYEMQLETMMLASQEQKQTLSIPMVNKNGFYYDLDIDTITTPNGTKALIMYITQKSQNATSYLQAIQQINKQTLIFEQNSQEKEKQEQYLELVNQTLITFNVNVDGIITDINDAGCHFLALEKPQLLTKHFSEFFHSRGSELQSNSKILSAINKDGENILFHATVIPLNQNGTIVENLIICQDVTYLAHVQQELQFASQYDTLTSLPNRSFLLHKIDEALENAEENKTIVALCYLNIRSFKTINEEYGHHAGDMLLKYIAQVLKNYVRDFDTIARVGADKFAIVLTQLSSQEDLKTVLTRLASIPESNNLIYSDEDVIGFDFSLGLAQYPNDATNTKELFTHAKSNIIR